MQPIEQERRKEARRSEPDEHTEDRIPMFLTAQELQARDPARDEERRREDRRKNTLGEKPTVRKQEG